VFLCFHLFENTSAVHGREAFNDTVMRINEMPFILAAEVGGIWLPLLFHGGLGIAIALQGRGNALAYPYARNWMYWLQRTTGFVVLAFIVFHMMNFRFLDGHFTDRTNFLPVVDGVKTGSDPFLIVKDQLAEPGVLIFYVVGMAATVFHFANGMSGFLFSWGVTVGPRSKRLAGFACAGLGVGVFALGMRALLAFT